jgi:hypothetical protein
MNNTSRYGKLVLTAAACLLMAACSKSSDSNKVAPAAVNPSEVDSSDMSRSGNAVANSDVSGLEVVAGQVSQGETARSLEEIFAAYPVLATRAAFLGTITRVVETDASTLDLYAGDVLAMTLEWHADSNSYTVRSSTSGFVADSIVRTMSDSQQVQDSVLEKLHFVTSDCRTEQQQDQNQDKGQDKQDQNQDKQQEAPKEQQYCAAIEIDMTLTKVEEKQEQEQDQDKGKDQGQQDGGDPTPVVPTP